MNEIIKKAIKEMMHIKRIGVEEYALQAGMAQSSLSSIKGHGRCHAETIEKLSLNMKPSEFIALGE